MTNLSTLYGVGGSGVDYPVPSTANSTWRIPWSTMVADSGVFPSIVNPGQYIDAGVGDQGIIKKYSADGTVIWEVARNDFSPVMSYWLPGTYYDASESAMYVLGKDGSNNVILGKITDAGTVSTISTVAVDTDPIALPSGHAFVHRSGGSGNFTIIFQRFSLILHATTGAIVQDTVNITQNSTKIGTVNYVTADGLIYAWAIPQIVSGEGFATVQLYRGGTGLTIPLPLNSGCFGMTYPGSMVSPILWADKIIVGSSVTATGVKGTRIFERVEFDAWLTALADHYQMPT